MEQQRLEEIARQALLEKRKARGNCMTFSLHESEHVESCWDGDTTLCVALGCAGDADCSTSCTALLYDSGGHAWSSGLPKLLHNKLNGRGQRKHPWPVYLSMGSLGRYYLQFADGSYQFCANEGVQAKLSELRNISSVSFGASANSYFIVQAAGGYSYSGIPTGMHTAINTNKYKKKCFANVSLGPGGEWFVRWTDGSWKGGGWPDDLNERWKELERSGRTVKQILFGPASTWFIRYS